MSNKPIVNITNLDGNIFAVLGAATRAMKKAGISQDTTKELSEKVFASNSYEEALSTISNYVEFEG